jgi:hypothetical protein
MTNQANKQTQNLKNNINIKIDMDGTPKKRAPRRKAKSQSGGGGGGGEAMPIAGLDYMPPAPQAWGISAYAPRPVTYAPSTQMIHHEGDPNGIPSYFDKFYTNYEATLNDMPESFQRELEDVREQMMAQAQKKEHLDIIDKTSREAQTAFDDVLPAPRMPHADPPPPTPVSPAPPASPNFDIPAYLYPAPINVNGPRSPIAQPMAQDLPPPPREIPVDANGIVQQPASPVRPPMPPAQPVLPAPQIPPALPMPLPPLQMLNNRPIVPMINNPLFEIGRELFQPPAELPAAQQPLALPAAQAPLALPAAQPQLALPAPVPMDIVAEEQRRLLYNQNAPIVEEPEDAIQYPIRRPRRPARQQPYQPRRERRRPAQLAGMYPGVEQLPFDFPAPQQQQLALPAPEQLALPAPQEQLALPAPQQQLALPAPQGYLALPAPEQALAAPPPDPGPYMGVENYNRAYAEANDLYTRYRLASKNSAEKRRLAEQIRAIGERVNIRHNRIDKLIRQMGRMGTG